MSQFGSFHFLCDLAETPFSQHGVDASTKDSPVCMSSTGGGVVTMPEPHDTFVGEIETVDRFDHIQQSDGLGWLCESESAVRTLLREEQPLQRQLLKNLREEVIRDGECRRQILDGRHRLRSSHGDIRDRLEGIFALLAEQYTHGIFRLFSLKIQRGSLFVK